MYNVFGMGEVGGGGGREGVLRGQMCLCVYVYILVGCFPFNHNITSGLNFQQLLVANGTVFSKFPKRGQSHVVYPNFLKFLL